MYDFHHETRAQLGAPVERAFAHLDDFRRLSVHMERSSAMLLGSKMNIETDSADGRAVGSRVRMAGRVLGFTLELVEVVTERNPPLRKAWKTLNASLLVIGQYRLGFDLSPSGAGSTLRVFIDYTLPSRAPARWLGRLFGAGYARWCTARMAGDAARYFESAQGGPG